METGPTRRTRARSTAHNTDEKEYGAIDQCDNDQQYKEKQDAMRAEEDEFKDKLNQNEGDVDEISLSLEETNKLRISLGLKPLDTDATAPAAAGTTAHQDQQAVENFQKLEQQRIATEQKSAIALRLQKARQRILDLKRKQGQTIGGADTEEESTKDWVKRTRHNKPQSQQEVFDQFDADIERQYTSQDLKGLRVTHDISKLQNESDVVLTLADTNVLDENDDNLENIAIRDEDRLQKNIRARKRIRQSVSDEENEDDSLLSKYDNEKEKSGFLLDSKVSLLKATDRNEDSPSQILSTDVSNYDHDEHGDNKEPYSDYKSIKRKHRKDRKHKPKRTRNEDISEEYGQLADPARIEISHKVPENESFIDDEDLRQALAEERKHVFEQKQKRLNIDPIKLLKEYEALEQSNDIMPGDGLVIDSTSEFASTIKIENEAEQHMPVPQDFQISRDTTAESDAEMTDSTGNYVKAEPSYEPEIPRAVAQEELLVSGGVGAALALLRQKGMFHNLKVMIAAPITELEFV